MENDHDNFSPNEQQASTGDLEQGSENKRNESDSTRSEFEQSLESSGQRDPESDSGIDLDLSRIFSEIKDPEIREVVRILVSRSESHSGPIPSASQMAQYEKAVPGISQDILSMAKSASEAVNDATRANAEVQRAAADSMRASSRLALNQQRDLKWFAWAVLIAAIIFTVMELQIPAIVGTALVVLAGGAFYFQPKMVEMFRPELQSQNADDPDKID